jgi:HK97 family phage major capsid protein
MGKPVYLSEYAPTAYTAGTRSVAFGDFQRGYKVIDRATVSFTVDDMSQRTSGLIRYSSRMRCDAKPVDTSAIKVLISA